MMRVTYLQEKPLTSSPQVATKSRFAPRSFDPPIEVREPPSAESPNRTARFGHSFADVDIFPTPVVQPKLVLGAVGDRYEQEADQVARRVVETISSSDHESVQRQEDLEDEEEPELEETLEEAAELRRKVTGIEPAGGAAVGPGLESAIHRARGGGHPLSGGFRQPMERAFGTDFGGVRVHTDGEADSLNRSLQARAFTAGQDIFLRQGEYRPGSSEGQRLLAHELTHVVQQSGYELKRGHLQAKNSITLLFSSYPLVQRTYYHADGSLMYYPNEIINDITPHMSDWKMGRVAYRYSANGPGQALNTSPGDYNILKNLWLSRNDKMPQSNGSRKDIIFSTGGSVSGGRQVKDLHARSSYGSDFMSFLYHVRLKQ